VTIDSTVFQDIMKEICPDFDVSREVFSGENRETFEIEDILLRFQTPQSEQAKAIRGDDRNRWSSHVCSLSAVEKRSSWPVFDIARDEA